MAQGDVLYEKGEGKILYHKPVSDPVILTQGDGFGGDFAIAGKTTGGAEKIPDKIFRSKSTGKHFGINVPE